MELKPGDCHFLEQRLELRLQTGGNRQLCHLHLGDHMFLKRLTPSCTCTCMPSCMQHKLFPHLSHLPSAPLNTADGMKAAFVLAGYYNERKEVRHLQLYPKKKKTCFLFNMAANQSTHSHFVLDRSRRQRRSLWCCPASTFTQILHNTAIYNPTPSVRF